MATPLPVPLGPGEPGTHVNTRAYCASRASVRRAYAHTMRLSFQESTSFFSRWRIPSVRPGVNVTQWCPELLCPWVPTVLEEGLVRSGVVTEGRVWVGPGVRHDT